MTSNHDKEVRRIFSQYCLTAVLLTSYVVLMSCSGIEGLPGFVGPLFAKIDIHPVNRWIVLPFLFFGLFLIILRKILDTKRQTFLLLFFVVFALLFSVSVCMIDGGPSKLGEPFTRTTLEYYGDIGKVGNPATFLRDYVSLMPSVSEHAKSRPPGAILFLWLGSQLLGDGLLRSALWVIFFGSLSCVPLYLLARELYGARVAACSAALYILAPNIVLFTATSITMVNAFFMLVSVYLFLKAMNTDGLLYSVFAGVSLSASCFMTFFEHGVIGVLFVIIVIYYARTRKNTLECLAKVGTMLAAFLGIYVLLFLLTGFNLVECVIYAFYLLRRQMSASPGQSSYLYWFVGKPVAFFLFVGVPIAVLYFRELTRTVTRAALKLHLDGITLTDVFVIASAVVFVCSDLPSLKGEVERTWLSLVPFAVIPAAKEMNAIMESTESSKLIYLTVTLLFIQVIIFESIFYTSW